MTKRPRVLGTVLAVGLVLTATSGLAARRTPHPLALSTAAHSKAELDRQLAGVLAAQPKADATGRRGAGGHLVTYRAAQRRVGTFAGDARLFRTDVGTSEPSLGIAPDGWVYLKADVKVVTGPVFHTVHGLVRTRDGVHYENVGPAAGGQDTHQYTEDPYLYVDPVTGRVFDNDLTFPCQQTSLSDDGGKTWTESVANCDQADHQNLFAGPPPEGSAQPSGYARVVYDCAINGGALAGTTSAATSCDKSLDGGRTFLPTGSFPFVADPAKDVPPGTCDGTTGHGFADHRGRVYLPRGWCGQPWLAISEDEGASWRRVQVSDLGMNAGDDGPPDHLPVYDHEAAVTVDTLGNIYYFWVGYDYKPYLSVSRDRGTHWSRPLMIAPPGVRQAVLPALAAPTVAEPGHLAFAFMGSTDAPKDVYPRNDDRYGKASWSGYLVTTTTALDRDPVFHGGPINDVRDPLVKGTCGPVRCQAEYDFIDVQVAPDGRPWAIFVDACAPGAACAATGQAVLGTVAGGDRLGSKRR